jgi:hypothetical protein
MCSNFGLGACAKGSIFAYSVRVRIKAARSYFCCFAYLNRPLQLAEIAFPEIEKGASHE